MMTLATKEDKDMLIVQIDSRLKSLSSTIDKHPENAEGLQKLYDALMDKRDELTRK